MISVDQYDSSPSHEGFLNRMDNSVFLYFFFYTSARKPKADTFLSVNKPQPLTIYLHSGFILFLYQCSRLSSLYFGQSLAERRKGS